MLTTSNYARQGTNPNAYAISIKPPSWYKGKSLPILAPTWDMVMSSKNGTISQHQYSDMYFNHLLKQRVTIEDVVGALPDDACLLCYEPPFIFCHRRLVALWIETELKIEVPEVLDKTTIITYNFRNNTLEF